MQKAVRSERDTVQSVTQLPDWRGAWGMSSRSFRIIVQTSDTVGAGRKWTGYVKNLRKDGAHYWVYATAIPNVRNGVVVGYTSVRRKPSRSKVDSCTTLYAQMVAQEGSTS